MTEVLKCDIVGCGNNAEEISRPLMKSNSYCKKHFFEIYYGEDIIEIAESMSIEKVRAITTDIIEDEIKALKLRGKKRDRDGDC